MTAKDRAAHVEREAVAGVIAKHRSWPNPIDGCLGCDWKPDDGYYAGTKHAQHVADAVLAALPQTGDAAADRLSHAERELLRPVLARYAQWDDAHDGPVFEAVEQVMHARLADLAEALETAREQRHDVLELLDAERAERAERKAVDKEPIEVGWYAYAGGAQTMIFHLRQSGQWSAHFDNGTAGDCAWGYIEQALGVWDLVRIDPSPALTAGADQ